jgi:hypothetical protein
MTKTGGSSGRRGVFVVDTEAMVAFVGSVMRPSVATVGGLPAGGLSKLHFAGVDVHPLVVRGAATSPRVGSIPRESPHRDSMAATALCRVDGNR